MHLWIISSKFFCLLYEYIANVYMSKDYFDNQIKSFIILVALRPKSVTSLLGTSPRHSAGQRGFDDSKKCCNGGEPLATLCRIWLARDLKLRPPAP